jgi:hypothetical protein
MDPVTITALSKFIPLAAGKAAPLAEGISGATSLVGGLIQNRQAMRELPQAVDPFVKSAMTRLQSRIRTLEVGTAPKAKANRFPVRSGRALMSAINRSDVQAGNLAASLQQANLRAAEAMEGQLAALSRYTSDKTTQLSMYRHLKKTADGVNSVQQGEDMLMRAVAGATKPGGKTGSTADAGDGTGNVTQTDITQD